MGIVMKNMTIGAEWELILKNRAYFPSFESKAIDVSWSLVVGRTMALQL